MKTFYNLLCFCMLFILINSKCQEIQQAQEQPTVKVKIAIAQKQEIGMPIRASGKVSANSEIKLSFKTGGIIRRIFVNEGETVYHGQKIAELDLSEITARLNQIKLQHNKAKRDLQRAKNLYRDTVATLEQYQDAKTAFDVLKAELRAAEFNFKHSTIHAPSKGKILKCFFEENELIAAGHPVFLLGATTQNWKMKTNITDKDIVKIQINDSAEIRFDAYPNKAFRAVIHSIGKFADPYTGTFEVELVITPTEEELMSGLIGKVIIYPAKKEKLIRIPTEALLAGDKDIGSVFIVKNNKPYKKQIHIAHITQNGLFLNKGLAAGDTLITGGVNLVENESKIQISQ